MAIAGLLGTGATTYSAVELGRGNRSESEKALNTVFIFTLGIGLFFAIVSFLGIEPILRLSGAALATITSQFVSACIMVSYFMKKSNIMRLSRTALRPNMKLCLEIVKLGISAGITQFAAFIMQIVMNNTLQYYGNQSGITGGVALGAMGIDGVLYAGLIADISSGVIIAIFIVPEMRKLRGGNIENFYFSYQRNI